MTATMTRNSSAPATGRPTRSYDAVLATTTATVAGGMFLTTLPLSSIFTDWSWLTVSIGCALPYLIIVAGLRYLGPARWWHSVVGLIASVLMLLWVFVPQHLGFGVVPSPTSLRDIGSLVRQARNSMQAEHAPLHSTNALRLLVAAALVGLACLTDVLGVLLRRPLLAAAPLLEVLAVASATSSRSANPIWFAAAAIGFLLILLSGTRLQDRAWGPSVDGSAGRLGGGRRMAVTGIVAALLVPLLLPSVPSNLLARAAHHNGTGGLGDGSGTGQVVLSSLASLRGSLQLSTPKTLFEVDVSAGPSPFYIRQEVDDLFTNDGWQPSGNAFTEPTRLPLSDQNFPIDPVNGSTAHTEAISARFTIESLGGKTLPLLSNPQALRTPNVGSWNSRTASVNDVNLQRNLSYTEDVQQLSPTVAELRAAPDWSRSPDAKLNAQYLQLPANLPAPVTELAATLISGKTSAYDKAFAISDYFTNGKNGFVYSLNPKPQDSRGALVTFLSEKQGYCQQYAAAAAVLMRQAGLPTRVIVGYAHRDPDVNGRILVTTADAHAWVEVYFQGIGWIPFDPTPRTLADAGRLVPLAWATHPVASAGSTAEPTANKGPSGSVSAASSSANVATGASSGPLIPSIVWQVGLVAGAIALVLLLIFLGPRAVRRRQRRKRLDRARHTGNPEPLWLELAATATDRDALWPATVTVGQVSSWLGRHGVDERGREAVAAVARTVERDRFSAELVSKVPSESITALDQALTRWARRTDRRLSLLHRWLPRSLLSRQPRWHR
ncbi:MAG: DUF3488 and transglutaminase-like domain-containing protein [Jatrophihabitantaceae bacterium]